MANREKVEKLQHYQVNLVSIKKELGKERNLNNKPDKAEQLKQEVIDIAKEVDKVLGKVGQVERVVTEDFQKYTYHNKKGINNQIKYIVEIIEDAVKILSS